METLTGPEPAREVMMPRLSWFHTACPDRPQPSRAVKGVKPPDHAFFSSSSFSSGSLIFEPSFLENLFQSLYFRLVLLLCFVPSLLTPALF